MMKMRILSMILAVMLLVPAACVGAQALDVTLTGTLELQVGDMGVDMEWFSGESVMIEPIWTNDGVFQLKDNGYSGASCLGCELQLRDGVWQFPINVNVNSEHFSEGYAVTVYCGEDDQEWYYEDGQLVYSRIPTKDGGLITYVPGNNLIQVAFVSGNQIITGGYALTGDLIRYFVETFTDELIATVCYTAEQELNQFSVTERETGVKYAFGGANGWFVQGESGFTACAAPEGFEESSVEWILEKYPPVEYGPAAKLSGNSISLSGSTLGAYGFSLGDTLTLSGGSVVKQLTFRLDAVVAPLVTEAGVILTEGSFVELLVIEGDAALFNPAWISADASSGVKRVQLADGAVMSYDEFLNTLK